MKYLTLIKSLYKDKVAPRIKSSVIKNILWLSFDKIFRLVLGLIAGIWVARYLGPGKWGELNYVQAYTSILSTIAMLGMDGFLVKEILEAPKDKRTILGSAFVLRLTTAIIGAVVAYLVLSYLGAGSNAIRMYFFLLLTVLFTPFDLIDIEYQSELKSKRTVLTKSIAFACGAIAKIGMILLKMPVIYFAAVIGMESLVAYMLLVTQYQLSRNNIFLWRFKTSIMTGLLKRAWPFMLASVAVMLYMRMDQIMLGSMISEKEVGKFSAAVRVSELFTFIPLAISSSYLPVLLKVKQEKGRAIFLAEMERLFNWMFLISVGIALGVTLFSRPIIGILYGSAFADTSGILIVHIWSLVAIFAGVSAGQFLVIEGMQQYTFYRTLIGLIVNIIMNILLIPSMHAYGAAVATLISQFVVGYASGLIFKKMRIIFYMQMRSIIYPFLLFKRIIKKGEA